MPVRKVKGSWWIDLRFDYQRIRKRSPENSKAGAEAYEASIRHRLARGESLEPSPKAEAQPEMPFREFAQEWQETYVRTNNKPSEQKTKEIVLRLHLLPWFGHMPISSITAKDVEQFKASQMRSGLSSKTINNHLAVLFKCLRTAHEWEQVPSVPRMKLLKVPPPEFNFLTPVESAGLLADVREPMWHGMLLTALRTGMRLGELVALDWSAIDFERGVITVRQSSSAGDTGSPKNNRIRHIPMSLELRTVLADRREERGLVFTRPDGLPINKSVAWNAIRRHCKRVGLRMTCWKDLRHTFASQLTSEGVPLRAVQILMGHSTPVMTTRYAHLSPKTLEKTVELLQVAEQRETAKFGQQVVNPEETVTETNNDL